MTNRPSRWNGERTVGRIANYDEQWQRLAAEGRPVHGEADLVCTFAPDAVLDAGCGTGRVAIELASRGIDVVGVDLDPDMLAAAQAKAPELAWVDGSLEDVVLGRRFDVVVMAGNVMIFVQPGTEAAVVANLAGHLNPTGVIVSGFQLGREYGLEQYDRDCAAAGLTFVKRYSTWEGEAFETRGAYAVSIHRRTHD